MVLLNISNAKSDGELGATDTRAVFRSKGISFLLNLGSNNEDLEFVLRPCPAGEIESSGGNDEILVYDKDKAVTGLVLNDGDELILKADAITPPAFGEEEIYWMFSVSGDAAQINSDTGEPIYADQVLTNLCGVGTCLGCPVGSGRLFENLIGKKVNFDATNFIEQDHAFSLDPGLSGVDTGFVLIHATTTDLEGTVTFVDRHEFGIVESQGALNSTYYPTFENTFGDVLNGGFDGVNSDPYNGDLAVTLGSFEAPQQIYIPPTHGHLGWAFRFKRTRTGFLDETYYACMEYDEETNTLTLVPDDPSNAIYKEENGALGSGALNNTFRTPTQLTTMRNIAAGGGSGTLADPYKVKLDYAISEVDFQLDGDVDDIVYFALELNFDDISLSPGVADDHVFTVATYSPPANKNNVNTNIKLFAQDNFTVKIGDATGNNRLDLGHSILVNSAFNQLTPDGFIVYVTVEKVGGAVVADDGFRVHFMYGLRDYAQRETDSGYNGQVTVGIIGGSGTIGDPYVLDWDVLSSDFVFAMGTSPLYFVTNIQEDNYRFTTSSPANLFLRDGDTLITDYGTDSTYTTPVSSDDNSGSGLFSDLTGTGTSPQNIYFTVDVGATGSTDEDRDGYRLIAQEDTGGGGAPGGNYTTLTGLVGGATPGACTAVKWNTRIVDIDFATFGAGSTMYYCVEDYTATTQGASNRANTMTIRATDALTEDLGVQVTMTVYDDSLFTNNIYDGVPQRTFGDTPYTQTILDDNTQQIDRWDTSGDFSEGDTIYLAVNVDEGFDGYGSSGATLFDLEFRSMEIDRYEDIADALAGTVTGAGSVASPYVIPHQDIFLINNLDLFNDGSGGEIFFELSNYQDSGAGPNLNNDTLYIETSDVYNGGNNPDTEIRGYGTDSTYTTVQDVNDDNGFNTYSQLDLSGVVTNGQSYYFKLTETGDSPAGGPGSDFSLRVGRTPSNQIKLSNFF